YSTKLNGNRFQQKLNNFEQNQNPPCYPPKSSFEGCCFLRRKSLLRDDNLFPILFFLQSNFWSIHFAEAIRFLNLQLRKYSVLNRVFLRFPPSRRLFGSPNGCPHFRGRKWRYLSFSF